MLCCAHPVISTHRYVLELLCHIRIAPFLCGSSCELRFVTERLVAQAEHQLETTSGLINELQQELAHVREADRVHSMDAAQHAEAAAQLRCQRDTLQDNLAAAQGTLAGTAAEAESLRGQVRDFLTSRGSRCKV